MLVVLAVLAPAVVAFTPATPARGPLVVRFGDDVKFGVGSGWKPEVRPSGARGDLGRAAAATRARARA